MVEDIAKDLVGEVSTEDMEEKNSAVVDEKEATTKEASAVVDVKEVSTNADLAKEVIEDLIDFLKEVMGVGECSAKEDIGRVEEDVVVAMDVSFFIS